MVSFAVLFFLMVSLFVPGELDGEPAEGRGPPPVLLQLPVPTLVSPHVSMYVQTGESMTSSGA